MPLPPFLPVVRDFKANAIGVGEERGPLVGCVAWVEFGLGGAYARSGQTVGGRDHVRHRINTKAQVVQAQRVVSTMRSAAQPDTPQHGLVDPCGQSHRAV